MENNIRLLRTLDQAKTEQIDHRSTLEVSDIQLQRTCTFLSSICIVLLVPHCLALSLPTVKPLLQIATFTMGTLLMV